jgi:hypothetical protein
MITDTQTQITPPATTTMITAIILFKHSNMMNFVLLLKTSQTMTAAKEWKELLVHRAALEI